MTTTEKLNLLHKKLDSMNSVQIDAVEYILNKLNDVHDKKIDLLKHIDEILEERREVLQRLAQ